MDLQNGKVWTCEKEGMAIQYPFQKLFKYV